MISHRPQIVLLGVDGVGKSSLLRGLAAKGHHVLYCPQFHLKPDFSGRELSLFFETAGQEADREANPTKKAFVLFWAMTLYPRAVIEASQEVRALICERFPPFDMLVYWPVYSQLFRQMNVEQLRELVGFDDATLRRLDTYACTLKTSWFQHVKGVGALEYFLNFVQQPQAELATVFKNLFSNLWPLQIVLLRADEAVLMKRIGQKHSEQQEFHEKRHLLVGIQKGLEALSANQSFVSGSRVEVIDTSYLSEAEVLAIFLKRTAISTTEIHCPLVQRH